METRFELEYCLTKKHYVQTYRHFMGKRNILVGIIGVIGLFFLFCGLVTVSFRLILTGLLELAYAVWVYLLPWRRARRVMKDDRAYEGIQRKATKTSFTDEEIIDEAPSVIMKFPYDKIKKIYITDELIVLTDVRDMGVIMARNGFTKGNFEQLMEFIRIKCPQLHLTQW